MLERVSAAAIAVLLAVTGAAQAQNYPTKPLTMVIPFAAGGPTDVLGRVLAQRMGEVLGQQVIVENVGGAGGMTGSKRVADAAPDGYTFVLGTVGTHAQSQTLYKKPLYNTLTDFTPVALIAEVPIVLITRKDLPVNNLKEFIAYAKANQAKMQFGSAGAGSATHLGCVLLNYLIGSTSRTCPIAAPARRCRTCTAAASITCARSSPPPSRRSTAAPSRRIAIMTKERSPALPERADRRSSRARQNLEAYTWNAIFLPKSAPADVVKKLNDAAVQAMKTPAVSERLEGLGAEDRPGRSRHPGISRPVRQERDREMGRADQGQRRQPWIDPPRREA